MTGFNTNSKFSFRWFDDGGRKSPDWRWATSPPTPLLYRQ